MRPGDQGRARVLGHRRAPDGALLRLEVLPGDRALCEGSGGGRNIKVRAKKSYCRERFITVDLLVLASLDQLLYTLKLFYLFAKQATITWRSTVLSLSPQLVFPGTTHFVLFQ